MPQIACSTKNSSMLRSRGSSYPLSVAPQRGQRMRGARQEEVVQMGDTDAIHGARSCVMCMYGSLSNGIESDEFSASTLRNVSISARYWLGGVSHHWAATPVMPVPQKPSRMRSPGLV